MAGYIFEAKLAEIKAIFVYVPEVTSQPKKNNLSGNDCFFMLNCDNSTILTSSCLLLHASFLIPEKILKCSLFPFNNLTIQTLIFDLAFILVSTIIYLNHASISLVQSLVHIFWLYFAVHLWFCCYIAFFRMSINLVYYGIAYSSVDLSWNRYLTFALTGFIVWLQYGYQTGTVTNYLFIYVQSTCPLLNLNFLQLCTEFLK